VMSRLNTGLGSLARTGRAGVRLVASRGDDVGAATGTGDAVKVSRLLEGLYPQAIPCLPQFAQCGLCSSHFQKISPGVNYRLYRRRIGDAYFYVATFAW
jgi:hypothetical protein